MMPTELLRNRKDGAPASSLRMYDGDGLLEPQDTYHFKKVPLNEVLEPGQLQPLAESVASFLNRLAVTIRGPELLSAYGV